MPDESLDQLIRQKLNSLHVPFREHDWQLFIRKYQLSSHSPQSLDALFADALSGLELQPDQTDWELFEALLPGDAPIVTLQNGSAPPDETVPESDMEQDLSFDQAVGRQFDAATMAFDANDWELMAARLDGNAFDQAIRSGLEHLTISPEPTDWMEMSSQLDGPMYETMRQHLGTMEVSFSHADWQVFSHQWLGYRSWNLQWRNLVAVAAVAFLLLSVLIPGLIPPASNNNQISLGPESRSLAPAPVTSDTDQEERTRQKLSQPIANGSGTPASGLESGDGLQDSLRNDTFESGNLAVAGSQYLVRKDGFHLSDPSKTGSPSASSALISRVDRKRIPASDLASLAFPGQAPVWAGWLPKGKSFHSLSIGLYGAYGNTRAELSSLNKTPGFSAGMRVEVGLTEQVSLITGLQYEERGFSHRFFSFTPSQVQVENIVEADMKLAEVPLFLRYYIPVSPKVRLYGQSGVLAMVSLREDYQLYQNRGTSGPAPAPNNLRLADPTGGQRRSLETYVGNLYGSIGLDVEVASSLHFQVEPFSVISLQETKGSGALGVEKRMYQGGIGASLLYQIK